MSTEETSLVSQSVHSITKLAITITSGNHPHDCHSDSCCDCGQTDGSDFVAGPVTAAAADCSTVRRTPRVQGRTASSRRVDVEVTVMVVQGDQDRDERRGHNKIIHSGFRKSVL